MSKVGETRSRMISFVNISLHGYVQFLNEIFNHLEIHNTQVTMLIKLCNQSKAIIKKILV